MFTLFPNAGCFFTNELNLQIIKVNIFTIQWISPIIEQASTAWIHFLRGGGLSRPLGVLVNFFTQCQFCYFQLYLVLTPRKKRNIPPFAGVVREALAHPPHDLCLLCFSFVSLLRIDPLGQPYTKSFFAAMTIGPHLSGAQLSTSKQDWKSVQRCAIESWWKIANYAKWPDWPGWPDWPDRPDRPDKYSHQIDYERGGVRTVKHAKLRVSSFDEWVSQWVTIISARDASASENPQDWLVMTFFPGSSLSLTLTTCSREGCEGVLFFRFPAIWVFWSQAGR